MKYLKFLIPCIFLLVVDHCTAQRYKSAAGIRMDGKMIGLTYSQRFLGRYTTEGNVDFRSQEVRASLLAKAHKPLIGRSLTLFGGGGVHFGNYKNFGPYSGIDLTLGAEHKIIILPITVAFELTPSIHVSGLHPDWYTFQSVFSVKYVIRKHREGLFSGNNQRQRERNRRRRLKDRLKRKYENE